MIIRAQMPESAKYYKCFKAKGGEMDRKMVLRSSCVQITSQGFIKNNVRLLNLFNAFEVMAKSRKDSTLLSDETRRKAGAAVWRHNV